MEKHQKHPLQQPFLNLLICKQASYFWPIKKGVFPFFIKPCHFTPQRERRDLNPRPLA